jgi:CDP-diacylglycerol pyrophosphatase
MTRSGSAVQTRGLGPAFVSARQRLIAAQTLQEATRSRRRRTGATGPDGRPGFILLAGRAAPATRDKGSGEDLQDHRCALADRPERGGG